MTPEISEWINKADGDWATLLRESAVEIDPNLDGICFHAQQCAEKYLKARLVMAWVAFRFSHDLLYLLKLVLDLEPSWKFLYFGLSELTTYAIASRYPGLDATPEQAKRAVEHCSIVRKTIRLSFDLPTND